MLVVVLVAIDVIVGPLFLLLILVVLLFTEPSVDAIVVSLSLSDLFPLVLFYLFSLGQAMGSEMVQAVFCLCVSGSFSASLSLAVSASASVAVLASISRPCCLCLCHCLCLCL